MDKKVVDWNGFSENFDHDKFAMSLVVDAFLKSLPEAMKKLEKAIADQKREDVAMAAHSLKGSILTFGAVEAVQFCQAIENLGYAGLTPEAETLFHQLNSEVKILEDEIVTASDRYRETG